jgi:hypothetical protein
MGNKDGGEQTVTTTIGTEMNGERELLYIVKKKRKMKLQTSMLDFFVFSLLDETGGCGKDTRRLKEIGHTKETKKKTIYNRTE